MGPLPPTLLDIVKRIRHDGFAVVDGLLPLSVVEQCANVVAPLLATSYEDIVKRSNRGPRRHYMVLKPEGPFFQVLANTVLVTIIQAILGHEFVAYQLAIDTPYFGSEFQDYHPDGMRLIDFGVEPHDVEDAVFLSVNFPLVDVNETNGPFEILPGTQNLQAAEADQLLEIGSLHSETLYMRKGDVMIRDLRTLHRGTPSRDGIPRPMAVWGFAASSEVVWGKLREGERPLPGPEALIGGVQFDNEELRVAELSKLSDIQQWILRVWPLADTTQ